MFVVKFATFKKMIFALLILLTIESLPDTKIHSDIIDNPFSHIFYNMLFCVSDSYWDYLDLKWVIDGIVCINMRYSNLTGLHK